MQADDALLFIDANKYLDLYRTDKGKKLLAPLGEQVGYIFVTQQVVNEVQRNKIQVAAEFLSQKFKELKLQTFNVPDHLSSASAGQGKDVLRQMNEIFEKIAKTNAGVDALALGIMDQISCSEDEVSKALTPIFAKAVPHSPAELERARDRKELGNPPGKNTNALGDQLTWEQILTHFKGKKRLWIISRDGDYGTVYGGKGFLNRYLYDELCNVAPDADAYLFQDMVEGIRHFVDTTGVKAKERLTPEEAEEIEKEEKSLPQFPQHGDEVRRAIAEMTNFAQVGEELRRAMAEAAKFPKLNEEIRRAAAEAMRFPEVGEELRRSVAEAANFPKLDEEMRRTVAEATRLPDVGEEIRRAMSEVANFPQVGEELRRAMAEARRFPEFSEQMRRAVADVTKFPELGEEMRRAVAEATKFSQVGEEMRRAIAEIAKPYQELRQTIAGMHSPQIPTHRSPKRDQEKKDEQPPTSPPLPQKGNAEKERDEPGTAG